MKIKTFELEEFWKEYEFKAPYLLSASDAESWKMSEIIDMADPESRKLWDDLSMGYTEVEGHSLLRAEIAKLYTKMSSDNVVTTAGGEEGIYLTMQTIVQKGDHVVVVEPCYQSLKELPISLGAEITSLYLKRENNWQLDLDDLEKAFRSDTKLLVINYPHNPSGVVLDPKVIDKMVALARGCGAHIFSDEMYRLAELESDDRVPSICDAYEKGIALTGMTKPYGLGGLRIGWLTSQDRKALDAISEYKVYTSICNSAPSEILSIIALRNKDKVLTRNREIMINNLDHIDQFIKRNKERVSWVRPKTGTIAMIDLHPSIPVDDFFKVLLEKTGVLIMPASVIKMRDNAFRIGFGRRNMPEVLDKLEKYLVDFSY